MFEPCPECPHTVPNSIQLKKNDSHRRYGRLPTDTKSFQQLLPRNVNLLLGSVLSSEPHNSNGICKPQQASLTF